MRKILIIDEVLLHGEKWQMHFEAFTNHKILITFSDCRLNGNYWIENGKKYLQTKFFIPARIQSLRTNRGRSDKFCWNCWRNAIAMLSSIFSFETQSKAANENTSCENNLTVYSWIISFEEWKKVENLRINFQTVQSDTLLLPHHSY